MFYHEFLAASGTFVAHLVALLVKVGPMKTLRVCHHDSIFYHPASATDTSEEEALHSRLLLVEQVSRYENAVAHLPKAHPGDVVRHRVVDSSPSSDEIRQLPVSLTSLLFLHLSVALMYSTRP
jgi:hypothetical protein